ERFELSVLDGALSGHGRVAWAPSIEAELELDGSNLDPGVLFPGWQGRVDAEVLAAAAVGDDGFRADIDRLRVTGTLRERRIELDASGAYDGPSSAVIERLDLASGDSRLAARGRIGRDIDVEWDVDSANLADFWPGLAGRLETAGRAHGPIARPVVVATAAGDDIELGDSGVASLRLDASVDATGEAESNLVLELRGARGLGHEIERLDLQGSGNAAAHHLSADVAGNGALISLAVAGALERPWQPDYEWRFELEEGLVAYGDLGAWRLDGPAAGALGAAGAELSTACWRSGDAAVWVRAARRDEGSSVRFALDQLAFRYFEPYLPEDAIVVGTVGARGRLELPQDGRPRGELVLETSPGRIGSRGTTALPGLRFAAGRADLSFDGERLDVDVALPLEREQ